MDFLSNKICSKCGVPLNEDNVAGYWLPHNYRCKNCANADGRDRRIRLKRECLSHYGDQCKCGETNLYVLSLDHINNGGERHRRDLGVQSGHKFYLWVKRNKFPIGFEVMCMNCQFIKRHKTAGELKMCGDAIRSRRFRLKLKMEVFEHYGGCQCNNCGNPDMRCLSLDHINGGGKQHRRVSNHVYQQIRNNNFTDTGYQVLCMNCQFIKQYDPHFTALEPITVVVGNI